MHRPARCRDREWTGGVDDPQQDRHTGKIAIRSEFLSSLSAPVTLAELLTEPEPLNRHSPDLGLLWARITRWTSWATVDRASHAQHAGEPAS